MSGVSALAVRFPFVLAAGGYGEHRDTLALLDLTETTAKTVCKWRLPFKPSGTKLFDGRSDAIHIIQDDVWFRWSIEDFMHQSHARRR